MSGQADALNALLMEESEMQRLSIAQKVEARRNARLELKERADTRTDTRVDHGQASSERPNEKVCEELHVGKYFPLDLRRHDEDHTNIAPAPSLPMPAAPVSMPRPAKLPPLPAPPQVNLRNDPSIRVPPPLPSLLASALKPYAMAAKVKPPLA